MWVGETTITLQYVEVLLGLPVDGLPVTSADSKGRDAAIHLVHRVLGVTPLHLYEGKEVITSGYIRMSWLLSHFAELTHHPTEEIVERYAKAYLLILISMVLLPDHSGSRVRAAYLLLLQDLGVVRRFSWYVCSAYLLLLQDLGLRCGEYHAQFIAIWADRLSHVAYTRPFDGPWAEIDEYIQWYDRIARRYIHRLEIGTAPRFQPSAAVVDMMSTTLNDIYITGRAVVERPDDRALGRDFARRSVRRISRLFQKLRGSRRDGEAESSAAAARRSTQVPDEGTLVAGRRSTAGRLETTISSAWQTPPTHSYPPPPPYGVYRPLPPQKPWLHYMTPPQAMFPAFGPYGDYTSMPFSPFISEPGPSRS